MRDVQPEFDEIYRLYAADIYRYLLRLTQNEALAADLLQDTMLKAFTSADKFRGDCAVKTWLCTIARNLWYDHCRRAENRNLPLDAAGEIPDAGSIEQLLADQIIAAPFLVEEERAFQTFFGRLALCRTHQAVYVVPELFML